MAEPQLYHDTHVESWQFKAPASNRRGGHTYVSKDGRHPTVQIVKDGEPKLTAPFGLSSYGDPSSRMNLDFCVTHRPLLDFFSKIDAAVLASAKASRGEWFGEDLSDEVLQTRHRPCISEKGLLRTKVNLSGPFEVNVWWVDKNSCYRRGTPKDIGSGPYWANVRATGVYILPELYGLTLVVTDLLIFQQEVPFK